MGVLSSIFSSGDTIKGTMEGAGELVKDVRTAITGEIPAEKRAEIEAQLFEIEAKIKDSQAQIVMAEAQGDSWLQRNWRPIVMIWFAVLISMFYFGVTPEGISEAVQIELMGLLKIGLGGYVIGQSAEVVADKWNKT